MSAAGLSREGMAARAARETGEYIAHRFPTALGASDERARLLEEFRRESKLGLRDPLSLSDLKSFTYWGHKRRLNMWDPARVASDTNKGIKRLQLLDDATKAGR